MHVDHDIQLEHAEEAAFLWRQRRLLVQRANQRLATLAEHDERIEAHLDGLRIAGPQGWAVALAALQAQPDVATGFVAAAVAGSKDADPTWLAAAATVLDVDPTIGAGIAAGLTWIPGRSAGALTSPWHAASPPRRAVALRVATALGSDVDAHIRNACGSDDAHLRQVGLVAIGRLGRRDLRQLCRTAANDADQECRAAAAWSLALAGGDAEAALRAQGDRVGPWNEDILLLAARRLSPPIVSPRI